MVCYSHVVPPWSWSVLWQCFVVHIHFWPCHGVNVIINNVCGEVAWAESLAVVVVDPLCFPCDLDNVIMYLVGHVHDCCGVNGRKAPVGIIRVYLAVRVLLFFQVGDIW
jgi:hypothetical protein